MKGGGGGGGFSSSLFTYFGQGRQMIKTSRCSSVLSLPLGIQGLSYQRNLGIPNRTALLEALQKSVRQSPNQKPEASPLQEADESHSSSLSAQRRTRRETHPLVSQFQQMTSERQAPAFRQCFGEIRSWLIPESSPLSSASSFVESLRSNRNEYKTVRSPLFLPLTSPRDLIFTTILSQRCCWQRYAPSNTRSQRKSSFPSFPSPFTGPTGS